MYSPITGRTFKLRSESEPNLRGVDAYRNVLDHSLSKSKNLSDMLRLLPDVVVQKQLSMQGIVELYRIKSDLLESLIKFTNEPLRPLRPFPSSSYILDDYLSGFLQDRSHICYCWMEPIPLSFSRTFSAA